MNNEEILSDEELLEITGGQTFASSNVIIGELIKIVQPPIIRVLYGIQPLYGIKPLYGIRPFNTIE